MGGGHDQSFAVFMSNKSADWMQENCARVCDELRVSGGTEWGPDHLVAVKALTDAAASIRAIDTTGEGK